MKNMTDDDLDAMENELANEPQPETVFASVPSAAVPTLENGKLSTHAAEFWFPESRDCQCCRGFKHGCPCTKAGFIACQIPGCVLEVHRAKMKPTEASPRGAAPPNNFSPRHAAPSNPHANPDSNVACRFEMSPGGCRFGTTCRFKHFQAPLSPANSMGSRGTPVGNGPIGANGRQLCQHFLKGYCMFGDNCRNAHY